MSNQTRENLRTAVRFKQAVTPSGKKAYEAYIAIWHTSRGEEVIIGAPSLKQLEETWVTLTNIELNRERAQFVWVVKGPEHGAAKYADANRVAPAGSEVTCSIEGCLNSASFIADRKAYCEEHRP